MRRWAKRVGIGIGVLLGAIILVVIGTVFFIRTQSGEAWLAATISHAASSPGQTITISGLSGALPFDIHIRRIEVGEGNGAWLDIDDAVADIEALPLLDRTARIETLSARQITVWRTPKSPTPPPPKPASNGSISLPSLPVSIELDHLAVGRLDIAAAAAGQAISLGIGGELRLAAGDGHVRLDVKRFDGPGSLVLRADVNGDVLDLQLHGTEPSGVLLADTLPGGKALPLKIDLAGKGPLADWHGRLDAAAGGDADIGADLAVRRGVADLGVALVGKAKVAALLPPAMQAPVGDAVAFDVAATVADAGPIAVERLKLGAGAGTVAASGSYNAADGALAGQADVALDLAPFRDLAGSATGGKLALNATASGTLDRPTAKLTLNGDNLSAAGSSVAHSKLQVDVSPASADRIAISGIGQLDGLVASGLPSSAGLGQRIDLAVELTTTKPLQQFDVTRLSVVGEGLDLAATAKIDQGHGTVHAVANAAELAKFNALAGMALGGSVALTLDASTPDGQAFVAKLSGDYHGLHLDIPAAEAALGPDGTLALNLGRAASGAVTLRDLKLAGTNLSVKGDGSYDPAAARAAGQIVVDVPQLQPIGRSLGTPMAGKVTLTASASGSEAAFKLDGSAMTIGSAAIDRLTADVAVPDLGAKAATIKVSASHGSLSATLDAKVAQPMPDQILLSDLKLAGPDTSVDGNVTVDTAHRVANGKITAKIANLAAWAPMLGQTLAGRLAAAIDLAAVKAAKPSQNANLILTADNLATGAGKDAIHLKTAHIEAHLTDLLGQPGGNAEIQAGGIVTSGAEIKSLKLVAASQKAGVFGVSLDTSGSAGSRPLSLTTKGTIVASAGDQRLLLTVLDGHYGDLAAHLEHSVSAEHKGAAITLNDLAMTMAGGRVSGNAAYDGRTVSAALNVAALSIGTFTTLAGRGDATGSVSLKLDVDGPVAGPHGQADLSVRNLAFGASAGQPSVPINLAASAMLAPRSVSFTGRLDGIRGEGGLSVTGAMPISFAGGGVSLPRNEPIRAQVQGGGRLEPLNDIAPIGEDRMAGKYAIDLSVSGTIANPQAGGTLGVSDGSYTNDASGMTLRNLQVQVAGQGRQFTLVDLSASDGGDGKLSASGKIDLGQAGGPSFDLAATLKSFTGARTDEVTAVLSGTAKVNGNLAAPHVTSDLTIDRADINIPQQLPASYVKLDVIRVNSAHPLPPRDALTKPPSPFAATLDVKIHDANRTFVRGDGLDSEWKGDLAVAGTSAVPNVTGELQTISGTFSILGKDFTIQRGVVDFLGSATPVFDIQAQAQTTSITAIVELQGTPDQPKLTLSSIPALPQDEILSQVMFGSGTAQLTPVQGLQIAAAAASLAGGGPGVLDRLRNYTGLDRLSLGQDNSNGSSATQGSGTSAGSSISGGKYVAPGVYVGVAQGITGSSTRATVQVTITPNVTVNATVGAGDNSGSSLGAQYQLDY